MWRGTRARQALPELPYVATLLHLLRCFYISKSELKFLQALDSDKLMLSWMMLLEFLSLASTLDSPPRSRASCCECLTADAVLQSHALTRCGFVAPSRFPERLLIFGFLCVAFGGKRAETETEDQPLGLKHWKSVNMPCRFPSGSEHTAFS